MFYECENQKWENYFACLFQTGSLQFLFLAQLQSYGNELLSAGVTGYFTRVQ